MVIFSAMVCIASTARLTASPLASASLADWRAIFSVWLALSALCLILAAICSIEAEASSAAAACSVAPWLTCSAADDSSWLPEETLSDALRASLITPRRRSIIRSRARPRVSRSDRGLTSTVRSPSAIWSAAPAVSCMLSIRVLTAFFMRWWSPLQSISTRCPRSPVLTRLRTRLPSAMGSRMASNMPLIPAIDLAKSPTKCSASPRSLRRPAVAATIRR